MKSNYTYNVRKIGNLLVFELVDFPAGISLPAKIDCENAVWHKYGDVYYTNHPGDDRVDQYVDCFLMRFNSIVDS